MNGNSGTSDLHVRRYRAGEEAVLRELFYNTIRTVNLRDYSPEQVRAWAPDEMDPDRWRARIVAMNPFVCVSQDQIAGYAGLLLTGHVDHFFVHRDKQRCGVGRTLMQAIIDEATRLSLSELTSDVSITARPFFEAHGFRVEQQQSVSLGAVNLTNFRMKRNLHSV